MKTKNQFLKGVATLFFCVAGVFGTMAQSSQSPTQVVCPGTQPYRVDTHGANVYLWTVSGGVNGTDYTITSTTNAGTTVTWNNPAAAKSFSLSLKETTPTGCYEEVSVDVTVNPLPVPIASANTPCAGGTLSLTGAPNGMTTYAWTGPNGFTSSLQNPSIPAVTAAAAGTYTLTVSGGTGCSASATVDVVINPLPVPLASTNTPCAGGNLLLTGTPNGMTTYAWTGPNGFTSAAQNPSIPAVTASAAGTYTLAVTNGTGCSASATVDVTINPLPAPLATADTPCAGGTLSLTGAPNGMTTYTWTGPNGFTSAAQNPSIPAVTASAAGTYTLAVTNGTGCSASATVDVTINPLPVPLATASTPCAGGTLSLTGAPNGMTTYSWTGPNGFTSSVQNPSIPAVTPIAAGTYTLTVSGGTGCSASATVDVTINPLPVPLATADTPCAGGTLALTGAPNGMTTYAWTGPNGFTSAVQSPSIPSVTATAAGTYTLSVTNGTGCSASATVAVTINPLPVPMASADSPCTGGTLTLTGAPNGMTTYAWTGPNGFTSAVQSPSIPSVTAAAAGSYTLTVTNGTGCSASATVDVTINQLPLATISYAGSPYCARDTAPVVQTGQGSGTYSSVSGLTIDSAAGLISLGSSIPGTYTITYSFTNGNCPNTTTTSITIEALPPTTAIWHN